MFDVEKARTEIEGRNRIRSEAQLPTVPVVTELRRLYELHRQNVFEEFFRTSPIRKRLEEKLWPGYEDCGENQIGDLRASCQAADSHSTHAPAK